jgi:hypothetical protein
MTSIYGGKGDNWNTTVGTSGVINGRGVQFDTTNGGVKLSTAKAVIGVCNSGKVNEHDGTSADAYQAGDEVAIMMEGFAKVEIGAEVAFGDKLTTDADGQFIPFVQTDQTDTYTEANVEGIIGESQCVFATALEAGAAAGDYVLAKLSFK